MQLGPEVLFVQSQPSQLDAPFYSLLSQLCGGRIMVALLNDGQTERRDIDPELGFVPQFPKLAHDYSLLSLPRGGSGINRLIDSIWKCRPHLVVVQDQAWREKVFISLACRRAGISVAMRSDKNHISHGARSGAALALERWVVRRLFDVLAPVSQLTSDYYDWKRPESTWWFPYPSLASKFKRGPGSDVTRRIIRYRLGIPDEKTVFLAVIKFVDRENPMAVLRSFAAVRARCPDASLILVGAGPLKDKLTEFISSRSVSDAHFVGYVPFERLQEYFFASDVFIHLARSEPWGASAQDALVANMALVVSCQVGSGVCHLTGDLAQYVVGVDDDQAATAAMVNLVGPLSKRKHFEPAWEAVDKMYTAESLARWWASRIDFAGSSTS